MTHCKNRTTSDRHSPRVQCISAERRKAAGRRLRVMLVFGTRPEAIKMAPVAHAMRCHPGFDPVVCITGQHRELVDGLLPVLDLIPDFDLDAMSKGQGLGDLAARCLEGLGRAIGSVDPDWVMVQGDTTSALCGALAAFYERIPVAHLEAGLRTGDLGSPFPEEGNRQMISRIADLHLAPTRINREALADEGIVPGRIRVTGNTVIDALLWMRDRLASSAELSQHGSPSGGVPVLSQQRSSILVTAHRRENHGQALEDICAALSRLARRNSGLDLLFPVHPNPQVREVVHARLGGVPNVHLLPSLDYPALVALLDRSTLVLTDSGGLQEEAPALNKPVLVLRETTERQEGVDAGALVLIGTCRERIVAETEALLTDSVRYRRIADAVNPYGDGNAAQRVLAALAGVSDVDPRQLAAA